MRSRSSGFSSNRRSGRGRSLIVWIAFIAIVVAGLSFLWSRGGEQPQSRVEKVIPPERLAQ